MSNLHPEQIKAQEITNHAFESTPAKYHPHIRMMSANKNIAGRGNKPNYVKIETPYMQVDGRIAMAQDYHQTHGGVLEISTEFVELATGAMPVCRATVTSDLLGATQGTAIVPLNSTSGAESTNPIEVAETSAIGRALGFMGFGVFGAGIASADDIINLPTHVPEDIPAESREVEQAVETAKELLEHHGEYGDSEGRKDLEGYASQPEPATSAQLKYLLGAFVKCGVRDGDKRELRDAMMPLTKEDIQLHLDWMVENDTLPSHYMRKYVCILCNRFEIDKTTVKPWLIQYLDCDTVNGLSRDQQQALIDWLYEHQPIPMENVWKQCVSGIVKATGFKEDEIEEWIMTTYGNANTASLEDLAPIVFRQVGALSAEELRDRLRVATTA